MIQQLTDALAADGPTALANTITISIFTYGISRLIWRILRPLISSWSLRQRRRERKRLQFDLLKGRIVRNDSRALVRGIFANFHLVPTALLAILLNYFNVMCDLTIDGPSQFPLWNTIFVYGLALLLIMFAVVVIWRSIETSLRLLIWYGWPYDTRKLLLDRIK